MMTTAAEQIEKLATLPDHSRVWVYQANRELKDEEVNRIESAAQEFLKDWNAHGAKMSAKLVVIYHRFVVLAANESAVHASGCSIDSSVRFLKSLQDSIGIDLFDRMNLAYRNDAGEVTTLKLPEFQEAISNGAITKETIVFNNLVDSLGDLRNKWEVPASGSWHLRMF